MTAMPSTECLPLNGNRRSRTRSRAAISSSSVVYSAVAFFGVISCCLASLPVLPSLARRQSLECFVINSPASSMGIRRPPMPIPCPYHERRSSRITMAFGRSPLPSSKSKITTTTTTTGTAGGGSGEEVINQTNLAGLWTRRGITKAKLEEQRMLQTEEEEEQEDLLKPAVAHTAQTKSVAMALLIFSSVLAIVITLASTSVSHGLGGGYGGDDPSHWSQALGALVPPGYDFEKSLISGAAAGISRGLSRIVTFPLDTIKTRQQAVLTQDELPPEQLEEKANNVNKGRLFDGLLPMLLIAGPANAAFFVTYDYLVALFTALGYPPKTNVIVELSAALLASLPANLIRIPAEVTKQRVQAGLEAKASTAARNILQAEGPFGLYVGGGAHLLRELPFNAVQFLAFRNLKEALSTIGVYVPGSKNVAFKAVLGAIAAGVASITTQPLDTIKTGQMLDKGGRGSDESYIDGVKRIYKRFGLPGLYLGVSPRFFLCAIGGAFYFLANEYTKSLLMNGVIPAALPPK